MWDGRSAHRAKLDLTLRSQEKTAPSVYRRRVCHRKRSKATGGRRIRIT